LHKHSRNACKIENPHHRSCTRYFRRPCHKPSRGNNRQGRVCSRVSSRFLHIPLRGPKRFRGRSTKISRTSRFVLFEDIKHIKLHYHQHRRRETDDAAPLETPKALPRHLSRNPRPSDPDPQTTAAMPKSKRTRTVHLTQVSKKTRQHKEKLFATVREAIPQYQHCFVFDVANMRNVHLQDLRREMSDSRCVVPSSPLPPPPRPRANPLLRRTDSSSARLNSWHAPWG